MDKFIKELEELKFPQQTTVRIIYHLSKIKNKIRFNTIQLNKINILRLNLSSFDKNNKIFKILQNKENFNYFLINYSHIKTYNIPLDISKIKIVIDEVDSFNKLNKYKNLISININLLDNSNNNINYIIESLIYLSKINKLKELKISYCGVDYIDKTNLLIIINPLVKFIKNNDTNIFDFSIDDIKNMKEEKFCCEKTKSNKEKYYNRIIELLLQKHKQIPLEVCKHIMKYYYYK